MRGDVTALNVIFFPYDYYSEIYPMDRHYLHSEIPQHLNTFLIPGSRPSISLSLEAFEAVPFSNIYKWAASVTPRKKDEGGGRKPVSVTDVCA